MNQEYISNIVFEKNLSGRDFVIGDIHGRYDEFITELDKVKFDKAKDRVFSVGDLVDRGKDSFKCLELTREKWFHATMGNHEAMLLAAYEDSNEIQLHFQNGGQWFYDADIVDAEDKFQCADMIRHMPLSITIGDIGICHAQPPSKDWSDIKQPSKWHIDNMLWGREWLQSDLSVIGIKETYHGHTGVFGVQKVGNCNFIDTGYAAGYLSLVEI